MNAYQTIVIIALFAILGALMAPSVNATPEKACVKYNGEIVVVPVFSPCPAGTS